MSGSIFETFNDLNNQREPVAPVALDIDAERLRDSFASYCRRYTFSRGDLVREKTGLRIGSRPKTPNNLFIVMELYPNAKRDFRPEVLSNGTYGMAFDIQVGYFDEDGDFIFSWGESSRFEPFNEKELEQPK